MKFLKSAKFKVIGLSAGVFLGLFSFINQPATSADVSLGGPYDNNANAVTWGGVGNTQAVQSDYNHGDGHNSAASIDHIYNYFHISSSDINNLSNTAVAGSVTKAGNVYVGNRLVATNAMTAGREYISGGSTRVNNAGTVFYARRPSVSFTSDRLTAYVVMKGGQFDFAILSSCGNPVTASPVAPMTGRLTCQDLLVNPGAVDPNGAQAYTFTAKASATNATITSYNFNLAGNSQTINTNAQSVTSSSKTYNPGNYTVSVTVSGIAGNTFSTSPKSVTCSKSFTVAANGTLACSALSLNLISTDPSTGDQTYALVASASAANASIDKYVFNFGDSGNTTQTITTNAATATSQNFVYDAGQTYNPIYVTVYGTSSNGNSVTSGGPNTTCATELSVPLLVITCNETNTCSPAPTCESSTGQTYPAGSSQCEAAASASPTTPTPTATQLVNTGPGDTILIFIGAATVGFLGYRTFLVYKLRH